jgi:hypothetical protein
MVGARLGSSGTVASATAAVRSRSRVGTQADHDRDCLVVVE